MTTDDTPPETPFGIDPVASRRIFLGMLALLAGAVVAYNLAKTPPPPPPAAIARDPILVAGRAVFLARCVSCHGESGRGDGPIARGFTNPPVGDLTDATWKYGDRPEQVLAIVTKGSPTGAMPGWSAAYGGSDLRAVSAYVYYLAGRVVPGALRE